MPRLSIVIPVYNSEKVIESCVNSILKQSYTDFEIILINDGSTDNSEEICKKLENVDKRVKVVTQINQGVSAARNKGIKLSSGEYVMFVDSDDLLPTNIIQNFFKDENPADFVMSGYSEFVERSTNIVKECRCRPLNGSIDDLCRDIKKYIDPPLILGPCFKLFKKTLIDKMKCWFPLEMSYGEDAFFVLNYLKEVNSVKCIDVNGYLYRKDNKQSLSSRFRIDKLDINISLSKLINDLVCLNSIEHSEKLYDWNCVRFFDSFTTELMLSDLPYREKRCIYLAKSAEYNIFNAYGTCMNLSLIQIIRKKAIKSLNWFNLMQIIYCVSKYKKR